MALAQFSKGTLLPPLVADINCYSLQARRSLTPEISSAPIKNVLTATIDLLPQTGALQQCRFVGSLNLFLCPSTRGRTPDSFQASCHPPRNPLETSLRHDPPASRLANPE